MGWQCDGRWSLGAIAVVALASAAGCSANQSSIGNAVPPTGATVAVGASTLPTGRRSVAPDIVGTTLDGSAFRLADDRGHVVALNIWASWCAPCRAEAPILIETSKRMAGEGVRFVGLNTRDNVASATAFERSFAITYPSLVDDSGNLQLLLRETVPPKSIPSTVFLDRQGRIAGSITGPVAYRQLQEMLDQLVAEVPDPGSK